MSEKNKQIKNEISIAIDEILKKSQLEENDILVIGCSTSEVIGEEIGSSSTIEVAEIILNEVIPVLDRKKIYLACQCCEHLNRALVVSKQCAKDYNLEIVSVVPIKKAGGSIATVFYNTINDAVVVENIKAHAGIDIGDTFIGMHLKNVVIPLRLSVKKIGCAHLSAAITRPKLIGGDRAVYQTSCEI